MSRRKTVLGLVAIFLLAVAVARIGRIAVLYDLPFTDDEYAVEFGGHIMATGHVTAPRSLPEAAIPTLGLFLKDGHISRADWPGAQAVWAIAELTRLGPFVWAILAARSRRSRSAFSWPGASGRVGGSSPVSCSSARRWP